MCLRQGFRKYLPGVKKAGAPLPHPEQGAACQSPRQDHVAVGSAASCRGAGPPRWGEGVTGHAPPHGLPTMSNGYRTLSQHLNDLKKENFSLKLRIYFLEERMQQKYEASREDIYKRVSRPADRGWGRGGATATGQALPAGLCREPGRRVPGPVCHLQGV